MGVREVSSADSAGVRRLSGQIPHLSGRPHSVWPQTQRSWVSWKGGTGLFLYLFGRVKVKLWLFVGVAELGFFKCQEKATRGFNLYTVLPSPDLCWLRSVQCHLFRLSHKGMFQPFIKYAHSGNMLHRCAGCSASPKAISLFIHKISNRYIKESFLLLSSHASIKWLAITTLIRAWWVSCF